MEQYTLTRATARTLEEWIRLYEKTTGDEVDVPKGFVIYYLPERGFALLKADMDGEMVIIYHVCGDAKFWRDMAELLAAANELKYLATICTRNIDAYIRFWHWQVVKEYNQNNHKRYICQDTSGRKVVITHRGFNEKKNRPDYWVTQYLQESVV